MKYDTTTKITRWDVDWQFIKSACMTTVRKKAGDKEPNDLWKKKLLICEHSPIRRGTVSWKWESIPYAISTHFVRHHEGCEKFVGTSRTDRTGVNREERSQMDCVPMEMDANIQSLINISLKRLCMCADATTRAYWISLIKEVKKHDENIFWACVPNCVYRGGCSEPFGSCNLYKEIVKNLSKEEQMDLMKRYDAYLEYRKNNNMWKEEVHEG